MTRRILRGLSQTPRARSKRQEHGWAAARTGRVVHGSGAVLGHRGDVQESKILWEAKITACASFSVTEHLLKKITEEAMDQGREPGMLVTFDNPGFSKVVDREWVVIPARLLKGWRPDG